MWKSFVVGFNFSESGSVRALTLVWFDPADRLVLVEWVPDWEHDWLKCEVSFGNVFEVSNICA